MKRFITVAAAIAMVFGSASCQKDSKLDKEGVATSFSVSVPQEVVTKAISDGQTVDELIWEVYVGEERYDRGVITESKLSDNDGEGKVFELNIILVPGVEYDVLFWAQKGGKNYYNTGNLKEVTLNGNYIANDEARDAFYGSVKAYNPETSQNTTVYLERPFAQINFGTSSSDWEQNRDMITREEDGKQKGVKSSMVLEDMYNKFNVYTGEVDVNSQVNITFDFSLCPASADFNNYPTESDNDEDNYITHNGGTDKYAWIGMNYVFASKNGSTSDNVTANFVHALNSEGSPLTKTVHSVPFRQNWRTNILGDVFTAGSVFKIVVTPGFVDDQRPEDLE